MCRRIHVRFTKWDGRLHWHFDAQLLGTDEHGTWITGAPGTVLQRGDEPPILEQNGFVGLIPAGGAWIAFWNAGGPSFAIYVDVCRGVGIDGDEACAVDMDLDVVRRWNGAVDVLDEDEFEEHQRRDGYTLEAISEARAVCDWLTDAVARRLGPFGDTGDMWLQRGRAAWAQPDAHA